MPWGLAFVKICVDLISEILNFEVDKVVNGIDQLVNGIDQLVKEFEI